MNSELVTHLSIGSYPINLTESYFFSPILCHCPLPTSPLAALHPSRIPCQLPPLLHPPGPTTNFLLWHPWPHFLPLSPLSYHSIDLQQILTLSVLKKCMFPETCVCAELISHFLMENLSTCSSLSFSRLLNWVSETIWNRSGQEDQVPQFF